MGAGKIFYHQVVPPSLIPSQKDVLLTMGHVFFTPALEWPKIMILTDICKCFGWQKERKGNWSYFPSQSTWKTTWIFSLCIVTNYYQRINAKINNQCHSTEKLHPELYVLTGKVDSNTDSGCMLRSNISELQKFHLIMKITCNECATQMLLGS